MTLIDKENCPKGNEIKICKKCGFEGTKFPFFHRSKINNINQYGNCKKCVQKVTRAWRYGISTEDMDAMLDNAKNCELCDNEFKENRKVIDHCHKDGHIRGILCDPCNTTLGQLEKNDGMLNKFINYLKTKNK